MINSYELPHDDIVVDQLLCNVLIIATSPFIGDIREIDSLIKQKKCYLRILELKRRALVQKMSLLQKSQHPRFSRPHTNAPFSKNFPHLHLENTSTSITKEE